MAGLAGIGYQQVSERYYIPLLALYGLMCSVPGLAQLIIAIRGLAEPGDEPTQPSPSPSPLSSSSSPM
jgi:hypothetical protein